jgi:hypothetical protein
MAKNNIAQRVAALEAEVARLRAQVEGANAKTRDDWLDTVWGSFANDPAFEEAMRLGREWRESFRPKPSKRRKP